MGSNNATTVTVTFLTLQKAAVAAIAEYQRISALIASNTYAHLSVGHRARLLGIPPHWAHYVLSLGEPASPTALPAEQTLTAIGSSATIRALGLRLLQIADEDDPIVGFIRSR